MEPGAHTTGNGDIGASSVEDRFGSCDVSIWQWDQREDCDVRQILDRIADRWSLLAVALLDRGPMRFSALKREIDGISQRMLTRTLRQLERDGIVERTVHPTVPPQVEYALTEMGRSLHEAVGALVRWTEQHQDDIARARRAFDAHA
ncbi:winged helix-turn-helix transcriptional regulator [Streptomyces sedi]|uniref:Helix-turn-helix transcriptional regulator n=1 Tax=Streptomyces sedi TaxID=555059 RepID=A0A5C4VCG2_9ACTN|nr:helix-turn-helix domain-containing protein [Streptomyces sedi]TNM33644.1 helix-turn-helix transcriptional regulator [Streptomyces sedi]